MAYFIALDDLVVLRGKCHCSAITFTVKAPKNLVIWDCNCSVCRMRRNTHFIVPEEHFTLTSGEDSMTEYRFGTKTARHLFCRVCGVSPYYHPRSNPNGIGVTYWCIDEEDVKENVKSVETRVFDGKHWEEFIDQSGIREFAP